MFTPKWKKEAKNFYKAGRKFLNYKRDLLKEDRIAEIQSRLDDLKTAMKGRGKEAKENTQEAIRQLDNTCDKALPRQRKQDPIAENIEVIFVSLVVAIGIRSYYLQPFRIPTGSMQPTLNGVIVKAQDKEEWPNIIYRTGELALRGRGYIYKKAPKDLIVPKEVMTDYFVKREIPAGFIFQNPGFYSKIQTFHTVSQIRFRNAIITAHGVPANDLLTNPEIAIWKVINKHGVRLRSGDVMIPKGTILYSGYADSGDLILADKVSYHFRKPKRGETFIFDTRGINTDGGGSSHSRLSDQAEATHYIKRCVGIPGDTLQIHPPVIHVNGAPAEEPYMKRVAERKGAYEGTLGYINGTPSESHPRPILRSSDQSLVLNDNEAEPWRAEYAAMGDNTANSLDSRYWGAVEEYNVVAPALFTLWPITTGHWGIIK